MTKLQKFVILYGAVVCAFVSWELAMDFIEDTVDLLLPLSFIIFTTASIYLVLEMKFTPVEKAKNHLSVFYYGNEEPYKTFLIAVIVLGIGWFLADRSLLAFTNWGLIFLWFPFWIFAINSVYTSVRKHGSKRRAK